MFLFTFEFLGQVLDLTNSRCSLLWICSQIGPVITGQYTSSADKVVLSCNMSAPHAPIRGHKWMLGDKTLKAEEGNSDSFITYT